MGEAIFKVDDNGEERFIVWSSFVDAPTTFACTAKEIVRYFTAEAVRRAKEEAERMLERARIFGSSSRNGYSTLADVCAANRAGPDERSLTEDEIVEFYVRRKKDPTKEALATYRKERRVFNSGTERFEDRVTGQALQRAGIISSDPSAKRARPAGSSPALRIACPVCQAAPGSYCFKNGRNEVQVIAHKKRCEEEGRTR